jgi:hypothetical protein
MTRFGVGLALAAAVLISCVQPQSGHLSDGGAAGSSGDGGTGATSGTGGTTGDGGASGIGGGAGTGGSAGTGGAGTGGSAGASGKGGEVGGGTADGSVDLGAAGSGGLSPDAPVDAPLPVDTGLGGCAGRVCGGVCMPMAQCCADSDCPKCQECSGGMCRNQANGQDSKAECSGKGCNLGKCRTCLPGDGPVCMGGMLEKCNVAGSGYTDVANDCKGMGCTGNKCIVCVANSRQCTTSKMLATCNSTGTDTTATTCSNGCDNNRCCGASGQACCGGGLKDCADGYYCDGTSKCSPEIAYGKACTVGGPPCTKGGKCLDGFCCGSSVTSCDSGGCQRCDSTGACNYLCKDLSSTSGYFECHGDGNCFRACDPGPMGACPNDQPGAPACDSDHFCYPFICQPGSTCH